ncbi:MAG: putative sulfate exporter family transporter [Deltaproteobacteria bacterium]|nr:putative sulfate exporter family transporter [Deltaproteobacteria bacterium]
MPSPRLENRKWHSGMLSQEDWWAVWLGLGFVLLGLLSITGTDFVGWVAYPSKWVSLEQLITSVKPLGKAYAGLGMAGSIAVTYVVFTAATTLGAHFMGWNLKRFVGGFSCIFLLTYALWIAGHHAFFAANITDRAKYGLDFSLSLGGGASFILALVVGLIIGNATPRFAKFLAEAAKPEWFIKTAIVFLGVKVGYMAIKASGFVFDLALAGAAATIVAYLIFWPGIYLISRKIFKLPRKTAAVLSSAISICGVSAAVATGGAVRAKPIVAVMVSALVVVYAVIELVVLPPIFTATMIDEPVVAGAAMGMAVKTDGADAAAGAVMDELMRNKKVEMDGTVWEPDFITTSAVMTKIWIDMFIGLWAFVLAIVWVYKIDKVPGEKVPASEIWHRFPKFVLGYFCSWLLYLGILFFLTEYTDAAKVGAVPVEKGMRKLFFMLTFFSIGVITNFRKLAEARFGRMIGVYFVALFVFVVPVAIIVAWIFHHGMTVPVAAPV